MGPAPSGAPRPTLLPSGPYCLPTATGGPKFRAEGPTALCGRQPTLRSARRVELPPPRTSPLLVTVAGSRTQRDRFRNSAVNRAGFGASAGDGVRRPPAGCRSEPFSRMRRGEGGREGGREARYSLFHDWGIGEGGLVGHYQR